MQSLDSSCQEADTIINDALLKLKGSAIQSSSSNAFRQTHLGQPPHQNHQYQAALTQPHHHHQQQQQQSFQSAVVTHHNYLQQSTSNSLTGLQPPSHQPPPYLFDEADSPPDFQAISANISDHDLLAAVSSVAAAAEQQQQQQQLASLASPSLLSNINSIISPSPVVPDMLLNTSPTSPSTTTAALNQVCIKTEKRALLTTSELLTGAGNIGGGSGSSSNLNTNQLYHNSSPSKKPKLTNSSIYGEVSSSSPILQPLLSSSSTLVSCNNNNNNNVKLLTSSSAAAAAAAAANSFASPTLLTVPLQQQNLIGGDLKCNTDQLKSASKVIFSTSLSGGSSSINHHQQVQHHHQQQQQQNVVSSGAGSVGSFLSPPAISSFGSHPALTCPPAGPSSKQSAAPLASPIAAASSPSSSTSANFAFFDIHSKIRELYLYLLIHDEKGLKESRRRHRTRSFVLERLVEREKLNTIVLNLYPGNKGYSLAFYQDDNQLEITPESSTSVNDCISNSTILGGDGNGGGGGTTFEGGGGLLTTVGSDIKSGGAGAGSSRLKQTQISSSSLNNRNSNNLFASKTDLIDLDTIATGSAAGSNLKSMNALDGYATDENAATSLQSGVSAQNDADRDDDDNLVEVMSWPYEVDDLLNSIDKEELPIFISDLLEARIPNVFYSGCVICQVRDYRQTFPISSNSCDIFHVLLKPTNEILFADINQIAIDSDISSEDKLFLESQLILATAEPLCLDPDPKIGRYAINSQHRRQIWNTTPLRRQMKKFSQISINRKRKIDQFTHNYGLELCDYLQRLRQRPRPLPVVPMSRVAATTSTGGSTTAQMLSSFSKLQKKPAELLRPIRPPNLDYPALTNPESVDVMKYAKAYKNRDNKDDFLPVLIEEYTLEHGQVYLAKLSIYQRPATTEYLGELYVDRVYKQGSEHKFSLGTRANANRYIQQFTEVLTEAGRKAVRITHRVPGQPAKSSWTSGCRPVSYEDQLKLQQQQQQQQQLELSAVQVAAQQLQQHQQQLQHQQQQQQIQSMATTATQSQVVQPPAFQTNQILTPALNATSPNTLPGNQLNINVQGGNIVGITTAGGNVQQIRQPVAAVAAAQQIFDASTNTTATVNVQAQPGQPISLSNGSLVFVQQQPSGSGIPTALTIQTANNQQKAQIVSSSSNQLMTGNSIRAQLGTNVPILQAQLKAGPIVTGHQQQQQQQQQIIQQKVAVGNQTSPAPNAYVTGFMNVSNTFQQQVQQQQQTHQVQVQQQQQQQQHGNQTVKTTSNAAIISLLNSAPAAMTSTPISSTFATVQQGQTIAQPQQQQQQQQPQQQQQQQQQHQTITTDGNTKVIHSILNNNLRKINMTTSGQQTVAGVQNRATTNLIAVGLPSDGSTGQSVRVTMSALASQLASPPALMTSSNFGYTAASATTNNNNNNNVVINNNNIKILNNAGQRIINASALRRDSLATAAPSPGSDSNASNTSGTSNLGFTVPNLNALLAASPSPGGGCSSDQSQSSGQVTTHTLGNVAASTTTNLTNQALFERLSSGGGGGGTTTTNSPGLSPQQPLPPNNNVTKNLVQHVTNVQSPAASISPLSSPPPQPSPQHHQQQQQVVQQTAQTTTTTLNLQGINLPSLQGAMATFPGLQNVQVQIPGVSQPISLSLSSAALAAASANAAGQGNGQPTSLLVSVPVTSTTQVNTMQAVPGGGGGGAGPSCGNVVQSASGTGAQTQTVVLTNVGNAGNSQTGSMLSLPIAQLVAASGVKGLNPQTLRTATVTCSTGGNVMNAANIIQTSSGGNVGGLTNVATATMPGSMNISNATGTTSIQLLGTLQQRPRSIQVVGTKPIATGRGQITQRNLPNTTLKLAANPTGPNQITTTANLTATPLVMTTQKLQLKLQKQNANLQQQTQSSHAQQLLAQQQHHHQQQQQQQQQHQQQHIQLTGAALTQQNLTAAALAAAANQKRRRSATDVNK